MSERPQAGQPAIPVAHSDQLQRFLFEAGVDAKIHYPIPIHQLNAARAIKSGPLPRTEHFTQRILSLPLGPHLGDDQLDFTIDVIKKFNKQRP